MSDASVLQSKPIISTRNNIVILKRPITYSEASIIEVYEGLGSALENLRGQKCRAGTPADYNELTELYFIRS